MKILAIDTSGITLSIAISEKNKILTEINVNYKQNHSANLMPHIDYLLNTINLDISEIDYFAFSSGPGSFTGLRVGAATIKAFSTVFNKKIIPISSLKSLAYNVFMTDKYIIPIIDAKSSRVFTGIYKWENCQLINIYEDANIEIFEFLNYIKQNFIDAIFLGDGANLYKEEIKKFIKNPIFVPTSINFNKASNLCALAENLIKENEFNNNFTINYLRKSQAERQMLEKGLQ